MKSLTALACLGEASKKVFPIPFLAGIILIALFGFTGCSQDKEGIFYSLEREEKAVDNSLPNNVRTTGNMALTTVGTEHRFYACVGSLFYRITDALDTQPWSKITSPIPQGIVSGVGEAGGRIFVSVSNGSSHGLYRLSADGKSYDPDNLYPTKQITRLFTLNGTLFASAGTIQDDTFDLLYWDGNTNTLVSTGLTTYKILAAAWDGSQYWFAGPADIFRINPVNNPLTPNGWSAILPYYSYLKYTQDQSSPDSALSGKTNFTDLYADPATPVPHHLYLCSSEGYLLKTNDGGASWMSSEDHNIAYQGLTKVASLIVAAAGGSVLREFPKAISDNDLNTRETPGGNFSRLPDLYGSTVIRVFGFGNILYAGTTLNGLWRGDYSTSLTSPVWSQE